MTPPFLAALTMGLAGGLAYNLLAIHSPRGAALVTLAWAVLLIGYVLVDEWSPKRFTGWTLGDFK